MTSGPLHGLRVVEFSAFVAAPSAGLALAQLGADVIRIDPRGGNIDVRRLPLNSEGRSLYWASLNRGKRSVELDVRSAEGNFLYGAYGDSFVCADGRHAMVVAITERQWSALLRATSLQHALPAAAALIARVACDP